MTLNDDEHEVARIIREHEQRLSDLEEESRSAPTPNLLVTVSDTVGVGDRLAAVTQRTMTTGQWNTTGWRTSSWGNYQRTDI